MRIHLTSPVLLPILSFAGAILVGGLLLALPMSAAGEPIALLDALFTATSAVCVTGLIVVDTGTAFSPTGIAIILGLIQLGGLGIMTFASLAFYLWRHKVTLTDRVAVGQSLLHDPGFHLGKFLIVMVCGVFVIELAGAVALRLAHGEGFSWWSAIFHSVSAFCNAGFSLHADSLMTWKDDLPVNLVFMILIILGGLGFSTLTELATGFSKRYQPRGPRSIQMRRGAYTPSFHTTMVLRTSAWLIAGGALAIFILELSPKADAGASVSSLGLQALFQSVTCRTAGFNTMEMAGLSGITLLFMSGLMLVGGSPGSTAGGIKTTTFRILLAFLGSQLRRREQTVVGERAVDPDTLNKALTLAVMALGVVGCGIVALSLTDLHALQNLPGGGGPRDRFMDVVFEVYSAFGTVGLSTGITPYLSDLGKMVLMGLMFIGRLGPIVFLTALQSWQEPPRYRWPQEGCMVG